jgi:hypothetical protein
LVDRIRKDLAAAEVRLGQCLRAQSESAEASVTNSAAVKDYEQASHDVDLVRGEIGRLRLALVSAEEKARQAEVERVAKERAGQIARVEKRLADRDAAGAELIAAIAKATAAFRKMTELGQAIAAAWNWPAHDQPPILLTPDSLLHALRHELFRVGGLGFPGAKAPRLELLGLREQVPPLSAVLSEARGLAVQIMKTGRSTSGRTIPAAVTDGVPAALRANPPPLTEAESRLSKLLLEQSRLAADVSPEGEAKYLEVVRQIAEINAGAQA